MMAIVWNNLKKLRDSSIILRIDIKKFPTLIENDLKDCDLDLKSVS